jgi:hypothetical protein
VNRTWPRHLAMRVQASLFRPTPLIVLSFRLPPNVKLTCRLYELRPCPTFYDNHVSLTRSGEAVLSCTFNSIGKKMPIRFLYLVLYL